MNYFIWQIENIIKKHCEYRKKVEPILLDFSSILRESFWIQGYIGNNSYGFCGDKNSIENRQINSLSNSNGAGEQNYGYKLFCPEIIFSESFNIEIGRYPVFRDHEIEREFIGLNHLLATYSLNSKTPMFICDNHNFVLEAWGLIKDQHLNLIHIDQHFDNAIFANKDNLIDIYSTKICDYIDFATQSNWIGDVLSFVESKDLKKISEIDHFGEVILNIDIDFFDPEVNLIPLEDKIALIFKAAQYAKLITISTSPGFIDQQLAIKITELFFKYL